MRRFAIVTLCSLFFVHSSLAQVSFRNDVLPILTKAGCNSGSCHAKQGGQNGFALTIFAYDSKADYREIVHNAGGRRVFPAAPEQSLLLLKATQAVEHEGGKKIEPGSERYLVLRDWIAQGMPFELPDEPILQGITVEPGNQKYAKGDSQQLKVIAAYSDGSTRDVTDLAEYSTPNEGMAKVDHHGKISVGQTSGEGVIIVRYMEEVQIARVAVPPEKTLPAAAYAKLPVRNEIDRLSYARHQELGLIVSEPCSDAEFIRRTSLDAIGKLPSAERVRSFLANTDPNKRSKYIDELLSDPNWSDHWAIKWRDLIGASTTRVGVKPIFLLDRWLRQRFRENTPYDEFVREILTAEGGTHEYGPISIYRDQREPAMISAFASRLFLGVRLDCAKCHHHPSEKWSQDDYFQMAAFFGSMKRKGQGISAPISGEPEFWWFEPGGEVKHPVTEVVMTPKPPDGPELALSEGIDPRETLVNWMTAPENPFFARAAVNRVWGEFFGRGIVHPVDDFRDSNPPANGSLLDWLAADFAENGYDLKHLMRRILNSHVYQISSLPNETNVADLTNFSRSYRRRLPAEVMQDVVWDLTGVRDKLQGLATDSRSVTVWNNSLKSIFMDTFGRPDPSAECPCERDPSPTMVQSLHLMNSSALEKKIASSSGWVGTLAKSDRPPGQLVEEIYLAVLSRFPTDEERKIASGVFPAEQSAEDRLKAAQDVVWALMNSAEFVFNH